MLNERSLQIFTEVYRAGSVHLAAQRLFISAQSVSKTILALEDELGEPLFVREHHRMLPTPRAGRLQRQAERILREFRMIRSAARSDDAPMRLKIYCTCSVPEYLGPEVVQAFAAQRPDLLLYLIEIPDRQAQDLLRRDGAGLAILSDPCDRNLFDSRLLFSCGYSFVLPKGSPLCEKEELTQQDIEGASLVGKGDEFQLYINQMQHFPPDGSGPRVILETTSYHFAMQMARAGLACAFVPDFFARSEAPSGTEIRPYSRKEQEKRFYLVHPRSAELTEQEQAFVRFLRQWIEAGHTENGMGLR